MQSRTSVGSRRLGAGRALRLSVVGLLVGLTTVAVAVFPASVASAGTDTVTNCSGSPSTSGSLPYEVENAAAGDTIDFSVSCPPTSPIIASIDITKNLTINGSGPGVDAVSGVELPRSL